MYPTNELETWHQRCKDPGTSGEISNPLRVWNPERVILCIAGKGGVASVYTGRYASGNGFFPFKKSMRCTYWIPQILL